MYAYIILFYMQYIVIAAYPVSDYTEFYSLNVTAS